MPQLIKYSYTNVSFQQLPLLPSQPAVVVGHPHRGSAIRRMHRLVILVLWAAPDAGVGFPALLVHQGNHHLPAIVHSVEYLPPNVGQDQSLVSVFLNLHSSYIFLSLR